jgi:putative transposase
MAQSGDTIPIACYCSVMARLARIVVPGLAHHVTQRGNRREAIFFEDGDHEIYRDLLAEQTLKAGVEVWAYCLMPNHVQLIPVPADADGLGRAVGETHRRCTNFINARGRWTGHLFQSRSLQRSYTGSSSSLAPSLRLRENSSFNW